MHFYNLCILTDYRLILLFQWVFVIFFCKFFISRYSLYCFENNENKLIFICMLAYDYDYQKRPLKNTWFWYCINERILVHLLLTTTTNERMNDWVLKLFNMFYTLTHTYTFTLSVTRRYLYYIKSFTSHYYLLMMMLPQKKKKKY